MTDMERLIEVEQRSKANQHRINALEQNQAAIQEMALSVRELATEMRSMKEDQSEISGRLLAIEQKPVKRLDGLIAAILSALAGALISAAVGAVLFVK